LNRAQRALSAGALTLLAAVLLFPAWVEHPAGQYALLTQERGRAPLFHPPRPTRNQQQQDGSIAVDTATMVFNCATLGVGWLALFFALRGTDQGLRELLRRRRLALACVLGALAPVPPFAVPRTYVPNLAFLAMGFGSTGHVPGPMIALAGAFFCVTYAACFYGVLWAFTRSGHA